MSVEVHQAVLARVERTVAVAGDSRTSPDAECVHVEALVVGARMDGVVVGEIESEA